ncbi:hypothetical protein BS47DRAFT_15168 [Hydnum rufescens UP504]|uniref:Uncharacterized protein n=1 Tax=Hydnum rufescens UP504 TaxID=1448309 RepID=A0A9P6BB67_9AGAM|nr:hypothetical protein BS47DRAFT_15168 [Hydnum rufescens UP504]
MKHARVFDLEIHVHHLLRVPASSRVFQKISANPSLTSPPMTIPCSPVKRSNQSSTVACPLTMVLRTIVFIVSVIPSRLPSLSLFPVRFGVEILYHQRPPGQPGHPTSVPEGSPATLRQIVPVIPTRASGLMLSDRRPLPSSLAARDALLDPYLHLHFHVMKCYLHCDSNATPFLAALVLSGGM